MSMRRLINHFIVFLIYATFIGAGYLYIRGMMTYRGISSWPSVEAEIIGAGGNVFSVPSQGHHGASQSSIDSRFVEFRYFVGGKVFTGNMATPDGGGLPINPMHEPWRAFYKPSAPGIAVLVPAPFRGTGLVLALVFSGVLILIHLWFTVPSLLAPRR